MYNVRILLNSYWFIAVIRRGNVTQAQVKVLKTILHYVCYRITLFFWMLLLQCICHKYIADII